MIIRGAHRLKLGTKINLFFGGIILLLSFVIVLVVYNQLEKGIKAAALEKAKSDLTLGYSFLDLKYPGEWSIQDSSLYKGNIKMNENFELVDEIGKLTGGDTVTIFQADTRIATNVLKDGKRAVGTKVSETVANKVLKEGQIYLGEANVVGQFYQAAYQPIKNQQGEIIGIWYVGAPQSLIDTTKASFMQMFTVVLGAIIILFLILIYWFSANIRKRLQEVCTALAKAGKGDFTHSLQQHSTDEIGQLVESFNEMRNNLRGLLEQVAETSSQVMSSSHNLTANTEQISHATIHITENISEVAAASGIQAKSVGESLNTVFEMANGAGQIAESSHHASEVTKKAADLAIQGVESIETAARQMNAISETIGKLEKIVKGLGTQSQKIGQIIEVITAIAGQTNLLALNAAIEAARAGEQGRGFAVVADEVRKLAEQSSRSSQQISELISNIQSETMKAVEAMENGINEVSTGKDTVQTAGDSFHAIKLAVSEVAQEVNDMAAAAEQMSVMTDNVVEAIRSITDIAETVASNAQNVSAASEQQLASMQEITSSTSSLSSMSNNLHQLIGNFRI